MAPVSNAEGGGRLMLSKGIDAECVKAVCMCVCVESFRTLGTSQCATKSGKERNGRTDCSSFLHSNDLFKNLTLSLPLSLPRLSFGNCVYVATRGEGTSCFYS